MKKFTFYTKSGNRLVLKGMSAFNCLTNKGAPKPSDLSFYEKGVCNDYQWCKDSKVWACTRALEKE